MGQLFRLIVIGLTVLRFGLDEVAMSGFRQGWVRLIVRVATIGRRARLDAPRGARLRMALEKLGPIFVKFGQVLSTRPDLIPPDIASELSLLQDQVPPFSAADVKAVLERAYARPTEQVFASFDWQPIASASVAQVHFGTIQL